MSFLRRTDYLGGIIGFCIFVLVAIGVAVAISLLVLTEVIRRIF
jgi:hypothetical protein